MSNYKTEMKFCKEHVKDMTPEEKASFNAIKTKYMTNVTLSLVAGFLSSKTLTRLDSYKNADKKIRPFLAIG
jgi:hypothetical protein